MKPTTILLLAYCGILTVLLFVYANYADKKQDNLKLRIKQLETQLAPKLIPEAVLQGSNVPPDRAIASDWKTITGDTILIQNPNYLFVENLATGKITIVDGQVFRIVLSPIGGVFK